MSGAISN